MARRNRRGGGCSVCGKPRKQSGRYCLTCAAAYMRNWRKTHPPTEDQRRKGNARGYANVYLSRGRIERKPCEKCGAEAQMHHPDYSKPLEVRWLCRPHHLEIHQPVVPG